MEKMETAYVHTLVPKCAGGVTLGCWPCFLFGTKHSMHSVASWATKSILRNLKAGGRMKWSALHSAYPREKKYALHEFCTKFSSGL